jgi:nitrogen fixation NifU-like protein
MPSEHTQQLYRQIVLEHGRHPHHFGKPISFSHHAHGHNRMCGDKISIFLDIQDGTLQDARFDGAGCAIMMASASLLMDRLQQTTLPHAHDLLQRFLAMMKEAAKPSPNHHTNAHKSSGQSSAHNRSDTQASDASAKDETPSQASDASAKDEAPAQKSEEARVDHPLGDLAFFQSLHAFPSRIRCATLPWETLASALPPTSSATPPPSEDVAAEAPSPSEDAAAEAFPDPLSTAKTRPDRS